MRYEHAKLLLEFARLMLEIAAARRERGDRAEPTELRKALTGEAEKLGAFRVMLDVEVTDDMITQSIGFRQLRAFFATLTAKKRDRLAADWRRQIDAVRDVQRKAKASGEVFTLADVEIETTDRETGLPFPKPGAQEQDT